MSNAFQYRFADTMNNIYTTVKPFYVLLKVLGLFPLTFEESRTKIYFKTLWRDVFVSIIFFLASIVLITLKLTYESFIESDSVVLIRAWEYGLLLGLTMLTVTFCYQISKRNKILKFLKALQGFDDEVKFRYLDRS